MNFKLLYILIIVGIFTSHYTLAQTPKIKLGLGVSHLYDLYEGPHELSGTSGNVNYEIIDIDLKGLNGEYTQFDVGLSILSEVEFNNLMSMRLSLTNGSMTSQFDNQYAKSTLNIVNIGFRRYLKPRVFRRKIQAYPFFEVGLGITQFDAQRYFIKDDGLFSEIDGVAFSNSVTTGCLFTLSKKVSVDIAPNFVINHSDAIDGYSNGGGDIMMQTSIGLMFNLY
ncbi:MAG: hypothetical protein P8I11_03970 [Bacteroidia bacterium]|nr:hypothetical protein [Bacteroidia bacterium]